MKRRKAWSDALVASVLADPDLCECVVANVTDLNTLLALRATDTTLLARVTRNPRSGTLIEERIRVRTRKWKSFACRVNRREMEHDLHKIWSEVRRMTLTNDGVDSHFFDVSWACNKSDIFDPWILQGDRVLGPHVRTVLETGTWSIPNADRLFNIKRVTQPMRRSTALEIVWLSYLRRQAKEADLTDLQTRRVEDRWLRFKRSARCVPLIHFYKVRNTIEFLFQLVGNQRK